jgi:cytochrome c2
MKRQSMIVLLVAVTMISGAAARAGSSADVQQAPFDPERVKEGRTAFSQVCSTCHTSEPNRNKIGPSLFGVVGRHAGSASGYDYSDAMKKASVTWNDESLDRYLVDPKSFVPGNKMPYMGVKNDQRRRDVIAYLHTLR